MKNKKINYLKITFLIGLALTACISCQRDLSDDAVLSTYSKNGDVFIDAFSAGLGYGAFGGSKYTAFSVDNEVKHLGTTSMRFDVPNVGDPQGAYAGGVFIDASGRNLTDYDALTFWIKSSQGASLNEVGFGTDFAANKYNVVLKNVSIATNWQKVIIPIPDASKLLQEKGMFWYSEGPENGLGYTFWIDDVKFEKLGTIAYPTPSILDGLDKVEQTFIGSNSTLSGLSETFNMPTGANQTVSLAPSYFTFISSNPSVATVDELGKVSVIGSGTTIITAKLAGKDALGSLTLTSLGVFTPAPTPTKDAANVISIFSNAYTNVPVEYYNGFYQPYQTTLGGNDIHINNDDIIRYTNLNFVGTQFSQPTVDASQMTYLHVDIQVQEAMTAGDHIKVQLGDFGANAVFGGGDDTNGSVNFTNTSFTTGSWVGLDIPLSSFTGLTSKSHLAQILFISDATISNILVDNIYFYKVPTAPTTAAPTPTVPSANVLSVFSDAYTNVASNLNPNWGQTTVVTQVAIAGNNTLKYAGLNYQGLQFASSQNVSAMTFLHIDYYSANSTSLKTYLISTGPVEKAKILTVPTSTGWNSIEIPLSNFSPVNLADIIQMKFDGNGDIYLDNIYFHN
ncbi:glycosyl hydrolase family 16 [Flavobacterium sp. SUN052]|uniref:glycosyl hydrolase family 16 n=1 Tax=Flavobacterium sp. SUN052 TaxID=3002441 RepID=UPI00237DAB17|nr:glycosyl hydrolase family 16 [Flavobacterium sp. SUN052]MEC4004980.1 glycosyl hydrolase family 16 [Flavobacterium sp. SUN052]